MRAAFGRPLEYVEPGKYKRLMRGDTVVMSNTIMELDTHWPIIHAAKGRVMLNGLGLGVVLVAILAKPETSEVVIVENSEDVIKLVASTFSVDKRVRIIHDDAFKFKPSARFDAVWHDIWDFICADNLEEMKTLHRRYGRHAGWQGSWAKEECRRAR